MWKCPRCGEVNQKANKTCGRCNQKKVKMRNGQGKVVLLLFFVTLVVGTCAAALVLESRGFFAERVNISDDNPFNFDVWGEKSSVLFTWGDVEIRVPIPRGTQELGRRTNTSFQIEEFGAREWTLEIYLDSTSAEVTEGNRQELASLEPVSPMSHEVIVEESELNGRWYEREGTSLNMTLLPDGNMEYTIVHEVQGILVSVRFHRLDSFVNELFFKAYGFQVFLEDGVNLHPDFALHPLPLEANESERVESADFPASDADTDERMGMVSMPSLRGMTQADAIALIREVGLGEGEISEDYHPSRPRGQVIEQSIEEGISVEEGTTIDLLISRGPQPNVSPFSLTVWGASTQIEDRGVTIEVPTPEGSIRRQDEGGIYIGAVNYTAGVRFRDWASIEEGVEGILSYWPRLRTTVDSSFRYREEYLEGATLLVMERSRVLSDTEEVNNDYLMGRREGNVVMYTKIFEYQGRIVYVILTFCEQVTAEEKAPFFEAYGFGKFIEAGLL